MIDSPKHLAAVWVTRPEMELLCEALVAFRSQSPRAPEIDALIARLEEAEFVPPARPSLPAPSS